MAVYICPMHSEGRQAEFGKCRRCGMDLLPKGTRFGLLRHMISPLHIAIMVALMIALMAAAMMMLR